MHLPKIMTVSNVNFYVFSENHNDEDIISELMLK